MKEAVWCIRFQTRNCSGRIEDLNSIVMISSVCLKTGWGHDSPGHFRHVRAGNAEDALRRAFGFDKPTAQRWLSSSAARKMD